MFIPAVLLSPPAGGVVRGSVTVPDQEERHDQTVAAYADNGLVVSSGSIRLRDRQDQVSGGGSPGTACVARGSPCGAE